MGKGSLRYGMPKGTYHTVHGLGFVTKKAQVGEIELKRLSTRGSSQCHISVTSSSQNHLILVLNLQACQKTSQTVKEHQSIWLLTHSSHRDLTFGMKIKGTKNKEYKLHHSTFPDNLIFSSPHLTQ